jgi:putative addiction module component (TIGR02574 family)
MIALDELKKIPLEVRIQIVEELTRSIHEEDADFEESAELIEELERRHAEYQAAPTSGIPWETFKAQLLSSRE